MPYFKTIGLQNFRLFNDNTVFDLAPITILTGINSSGKSSLIKSLQLLRSSIEHTGGINKLSFLKGDHNLGNFSRTLNESADKKEMKFILDFPIWGISEKTLLEFSFLPYDNHGEDGYLSKARIYIENGPDLLIYDTRFHVKGEETLSSRIQVNFPYLIEYSIEKLKTAIYNFNEDEDLLGMILSADFKLGKEYFSSSFNDFFKEENNWSEVNWDLETEVIKDFEKLKSKEKDHIRKSIVSFWETGFACMPSDGISGVDLIENLEFAKDQLFHEVGLEKNFTNFLNPEEIFEPKRLSTLGAIVFKKMFQSSIINEIKPFLSKIKRIENLSSIRANSDRLYSNHSDVFGINELLREFSKVKLRKDSKIKQFFKKNLQRFGLGDDIIIKRTQGIASEVFVVKNNKKYLLADLGFGYTQLLPILLKIVIISQKEKIISHIWKKRLSSILLLEEPESNLHPSYQSKLAELIVEAAELFNIQFIIETHSEYFIRNLQYLTAIKKIKPRDTKIYYFHQPGSEDFKEAPYRVIDIEEDGRLSNEFGEGFFDEIPRLLAFLYNSNFN